MSFSTLEMANIIEENPLGNFQKLVMLFCTLIIIFDGFDVLAIAFAAPALSTDLGIAKNELGYIFSAGLVGMMIGALVLGPLGDKYGRRYTTIGSVLAFGLFTLLTGLVETYNELLILRFLTGLGLGGAMPNATALMTEYVSNRHRNIAIAVIFLGMPIGGITGGLLAGEIIPEFGWPSLFYVGGIMPLILAPLLLFWLPESPRFLVEQDSSKDEQLRAIARKIVITDTIADDAKFSHHCDEKKHFPVNALFLEGRAKDTLLLWVTFFFNLLVVYFLYSWIPKLLVDAGYALNQSTRTVVVLNIGGAISPFVFSKLIKLFGSKIVLPICFLLGAISMIAVGQLGSSLNLVMLLSFFAGFFIVGGQISLNAFSSYMYPTHIRSTGVGWANGIGRAGSIFGPLLAGALVAASFGLNVNFIVFGSLCFITATASFLIKNHEKPLFDRKKLLF